MPSLALAPPIAAALLLAPALVFAGLGLMTDAPGEWGRGALLAWSSLGAALLAGSGLEAHGAPLAGIVLFLSFVALMLGGPPGLVVAAVAVALLLVPASGLTVPRWLPAALSLLLLVVAVRGWLDG
jgi:hypothetical protein